MHFTLKLMDTANLDVQNNSGNNSLELRFGHEHLKKVFAAQVKTRIQKARESLQEFEADCYVLHAPTHHHPSKRGLRQKHHLMP